MPTPTPAITTPDRTRSDVTASEIIAESTAAERPASVSTAIPTTTDESVAGPTGVTLPLPPLAEQAERLIALGVPELAGITPEDLRSHARRLAATLTSTTPADPAADAPDRALLVVHPAAVPAADLAPLLEHAGKPGFVVVDMTDLAEFVPIDGIDLPGGPLYLVTDPERGDELRNWSPDEALPEIRGGGRTPLTVWEGISWLLQQPERLEANRCFMTIGSRRPKKGGRGGLDARTPALWISGGTGRDGRECRDAPKVGWCWAGNRHTWLGFASAAARIGRAAARIG